MDSLVALSRTPLPTILVVAGILFWILAVAGSVAGRIRVDRGKQRTAGALGTAFTALGLILFLVPVEATDKPLNRGDPNPSKSQSSPSKPMQYSTADVSKERLPPTGRSIWAVNKSTVYLEATGDRRQFFLDAPSAELASQGAQQGSLLFDGRKASTTYEGKLFVFAGHCGTRDYDASGLVMSDDQVSITGMAPVIDLETCTKTGEEKRTLEFNFKRLAN